MLLMTVVAWRSKYFAAGSAPTELTVRRWLQAGSLPGMKIGGTWYIDEHAWLADGTELVLRVLMNG
ncbi:helix-turn-helix domain-containing protein [Xanthomonas protegens]|uniref:Helix-turn-helix domain-containing protein n=1 Tax=Xanthomonas protegens TaxID=3380705 RepID=A0ABU9LH93_9XANT